MICSLCPRRCGALRTEERGEGCCGMPSRPVVARAALHYWEEPVISGARGSGAVFFSGCPLSCRFCQNAAISQKGFGKAVSIERLAEIFRELEEQGAHNINLVSGGHFAHLLPEAIQKSGVSIPFVWNSSGYERVETVKTLADWVSVWLPDLKYLDPRRAARYSGAEDYPAVAAAAIRAMVSAAGPYQVEDGVLRSGVLIRHLLLPGGLPEAKAVMDWVAETFPPGTVLFSLMGQYVPPSEDRDCPELCRRVRPSELRAAVAYLEALGLEGYTQELSAAQKEYTPPFDLTGV